MNPAPEVLVVADDLSGAADSTVALAGGRAGAVVMLDARAPWPRAAVIAVDTDSRYLQPREAAVRAAAAVRRCPVGTLVYKKIDSTLRGHLGAEVAGCLAALEQARGRRHLAVVAPAFPAAGRTVVGGRVLVDGVPAHQRDPERSSVAGQLKAAGLTVFVLGLAQLRGGDPARALAAVAGRVDAVVVDALVEEDLALTVEACAGRPVLWVGSGGLARQIRGPAGAAGGGAVEAGAGPTPVGPVGPVLVCVGSRSTQARAQCRMVVARLPAVAVRVAMAPGGVERAVRQVRTALCGGRDTVVFLDPAQAVEPRRAGECAVALAEVALAGLDGGAGGLVATGGETARAVLRAGRVACLAVEGESEPGVVWMRTPGGLTVVTKAGSFGDAGALLRAARMLGRGLGERGRGHAGRGLGGAPTLGVVRGSGVGDGRPVFGGGSA